MVDIVCLLLSATIVVGLYAYDHKGWKRAFLAVIPNKGRK